MGKHLYREINLTRPEIGDIVSYIKRKTQEGGFCYAEDVCELPPWQKRGLKPWHVKSLLYEEGQSVLYKYKYYGDGTPIKWNAMRKEELRIMWMQKRMDDWEIAKVMKTSFPLIARMRSHMHKATGDKAWVKHPVTRLKTPKKSQEYLEHSTAQYRYKRSGAMDSLAKKAVKVEQQEFEFIPIVKKATPEQVEELKEAMESLNHAFVIAERQREQTLQIAVVNQFSARNLEGHLIRLVEEELLFIPWRDLCRLQQDKFNHYRAMIKTKEGSMACFVSLFRLDVENGIAEFQFDLSREFVLKVSDK